MARSSHVKTSRELRSLYEVLREWVRLNRNIGRQWAKSADDVPWWYNERAHLGMLAGAIWRTGGLAFEEFSETKVKGVDRKEVNGRIDLWFETRGGEFRAEVKNSLFSIKKESQQLPHLADLMKRAVEDSRCNPPDRRSRRLAIVFAVPYISEACTAKGREEQLKRFISLVDKVKHNAVAWVFPKIKKLPSSHGVVCPGIVVWIRIVRRSR